LLCISSEEVDGFLFHVVGVHHEEALIHPGGEVIVLFDGNGLLLLHNFGFAALLLLRFAACEEVVHLLLFFSGILHDLEVSCEGGGTSCADCGGEGDGLDVLGGDVFHVVKLGAEVGGEIVLLFAVSEGVGDEELVLT
jgi:hypothetical protein